MATRTVQTLHVEDDALQRKVIAHHLKRIDDIDFAITCVDSEDGAVAEFRRAPKEFVILDYHLTQGDGLSCLRTLRQQAPFVPIIAISGSASAEIAAELLHSGADDYISKQELTHDCLVRSVRLALARADAYRRRQRPGTRTQVALGQVCKALLPLAGRDFLTRLDALEAAARQEHIEAAQLPALVEAAAVERTAQQPENLALVKQLLHPILLELQYRLAQPVAAEAPPAHIVATNGTPQEGSAP